jgi:hypothetical protein
MLTFKICKVLLYSIWIGYHLQGFIDGGWENCGEEFCEKIKQ